MMPPQLLALGGAVAIIAGFGAGWTVQGWRWQAKQAAALEQAQIAFDAALAQHRAKSEAFEQTRAIIEPASRADQDKVRMIYATRVVPGDCALPADAVGLLEGARDRANAATTGKPVATLRDGADSARD